MKHKLKHPDHDDGPGTRTNGSKKADEEEFVYVRSEAKEEGATGGASITAEDTGRLMYEYSPKQN